MGTWGPKPFDSDAGLDALDLLAEAAQKQTDPQAFVLDSVRTAFVKPGSRGHDDRSVRYACAGLVAAALRPDEASLMGPGFIIPADLSHLMDSATAAELAADAGAAVRALQADSEWLATWFNRPMIDSALAQLAGLLS